MNLVTHKGEKVSLSLKPGQMVLYESATIPHGRQFPFDGEYYDNLFVHFSPSNGKIYKTDYNIKNEQEVEEDLE